MFQGLPSEKKYRVGLVDMQSIDYGTRFRVTDPRTGKYADLTPDESGLLMFSTTFQTLKRHVEIYTNRYSVKSDEIPRLKKSLELCMERGLLMEESELKKQLARGITEHSQSLQPSPNKITVIGIPTRNRPQELERCIKSYMENVVKYGRTPEFVIADDSDGEFLQQNRGTLSRIQKKYPGTITHFDIETRKKMAQDTSSKSGVSLDVVSLGICGDPRDVNHVGALRNSILLYAKGKKILFADDDTMCNPRTLPGTQFNAIPDHLHITTAPPRPSYFFDSYESAVNYFPKVEIDYLGAHEALLGRTVDSFGNLITDGKMSFSQEVGGVSNQLVQEINQGTFLKKTIAATFPGAVGHSWMRVHPPIMVDSHIHDHTLWGKSKEEYEINKRTPFIGRSVGGYTLYEGNDCISLNMAVDASELLPPFAPRFGNEDACFGRLIDNHSGYISAFVSLLVEHRRTLPYVPDLNILRSLCSTNAVLIALMDMIVHENGSCTVEGTANQLSHFSFLSLSDIQQIVMKQLVMKCDGVAGYYNHILAHHVYAPSYWRADVESHIKTLEIISDQNFLETFPFFSDMRGHLPFGWEEFRSWIGQWATLLLHWSKLIT